MGIEEFGVENSCVTVCAHLFRGLFCDAGFLLNSALINGDHPALVLGLLGMMAFGILF
jgi:hypothetical protein